MYRAAEVKVVAADDSNLVQKLFDRAATFYQTRDLETATIAVRVGTADAEALVSIAPVTTGYFLALLSDYPVRVRLNDVAGTQFTLNTNNVAATSAGAPLPDQCCMVLTGQVTSLRLQPITGAAQTANVKILVTGDPTSSYV